MATPSSASSGYRERLLPGWWVWLVAGGLVVMVAVAYGAALGAPVGWATLIVGAALAAAVIWTSAPVVSVTADGLRAGGALLPLTAVGNVRIVDRDGIASLRGPGADARLYVVVRASASPGGLLVHIEDDDDPHPAWLVSSRHPDRMAAALTATMEPTHSPRVEE